MKFTVLTVAKIGIPTLLLLLGINGLADVRLQKDMAGKSVKLAQQVAEAKSLSGQLQGGLTGLGDLQTTTQSMQSSLVRVQGAASNMASGLSTLATTVAGINQSVSQIGGGVGKSKTEVAAIEQSEERILATLEQLSQTNSDMVNHLGQMISDEQQIDSSLSQMNQKTALVP
ncbi:hypothetical protein [Alicyclobacillus dauci]|uniref:Methyl-accepting chemotaxis protein n=1 Tax=Alicyclobacillus dauci TaxID=1475485 RepID=A0ABY6YZT3_9BACL|nr:hypothetical protein [Alicyclobacillus dauci]WAH36143.1 hypothetical protein NZD86_18115 [Alicyclobacillus dauci]